MTTDLFGTALDQALELIKTRHIVAAHRILKPLSPEIEEVRSAVQELLDAASEDGSSYPTVAAQCAIVLGPNATDDYANKLLTAENHVGLLTLAELTQERSDFDKYFLAYAKRVSLEQLTIAIFPKHFREYAQTLVFETVLQAGEYRFAASIARPIRESTSQNLAIANAAAKNKSYDISELVDFSWSLAAAGILAEAAVERNQLDAALELASKYKLNKIFDSVFDRAEAADDLTMAAASTEQGKRSEKQLSKLHSMALSAGEFAEAFEFAAQLEDPTEKLQETIEAFCASEIPSGLSLRRWTKPLNYALEAAPHSTDPETCYALIMEHTRPTESLVHCEAAEKLDIAGLRTMLEWAKEDGNQTRIAIASAHLFAKTTTYVAPEFDTPSNAIVVTKLGL